MLEHIADFTAWPIITGILIGYVANRIMSGEGKGCCMNLMIGIIGSYVNFFQIQSTDTAPITQKTKLVR